jgi:zinc protease
MGRWISMAIAALALGGCAPLALAPTGDTRAAGAAQEDWMRTTLDNGLEVVVVEDHAAPVVALMVWVRVGSGEERPEQAGMAHVFEHMLFKGTGRRGVGEIARTVESAGGNINAFTSNDMTAYYITMASRDVGVGIDVLADALQHSTFDPVELKREIEVVIEEIRRGEDSAGRAISEALFDLTYSVHPYRLPVIGTQQSVSSFTREGLLEFFHHWYVPNNMTFVVVGDVQPAAVVEQIRTAFADARPRPDLAHPRPMEPEPPGPRARVVPSKFEQTLLGIAYKSTPLRHADTPYLDLLAGVLGGGESSRLYRSVKDRQQLVYSIGASSYTPLDAGIFSIDAELDAARIPEAVRAIAREVDQLRELGPDKAELERARLNLLSSEVHERETMQGQARKVGYFETLGGGLEYEREYLERIRSATADDVKRVAQQYLQPGRANVVALLKRDASALSDAELLAALESGARTPSALAGRELRPGLWQYQLPNGLRVLVQPRRSVPLVSLRLAMLGGQLVETSRTEGISTFLAEALDRGTTSRSAAQIAAAVEDIAGSLDGFSGRNSFGLQAEFLAESLDTGLELFADVLLNPAFAPQELEKLRTERLAALERREDNLTTKAIELLYQAMYAAHPYALQTLGSAASVKRLDQRALRQYYEVYAHPHNAVLAIVGDVEPDAVVEAVAARLGKWNGAGRVELPERPALPVRSQPQETAIAKHKSQTHVVMGFPALRFGDPDAPALEVLTQMLSGQSGRLFMELRDRQSLAYVVTAFAQDGVDPGLFGVYIASAPEKLEQARAGLRSQLQRLLDEPIAPEELERARNYLIGSHAVSLQEFSTQAALLSLDELYGLGADYHFDYARRIEAVTLEDVQRVARRVIDLDRAVIAVVK